MKPCTASLTLFAAFVWLALEPTGQSIAVETLQIEVRETAGIRRFGYPVRLKLPELFGGNARLRDAGKAVAAQFRQEQNDDGAGPWWLDFNVSLMPNEARTLTLDYGANITADQEPRGLELKQLPVGFEIRNGQQLKWTIGTLPALLKSVDAAGFEHLRTEGARFGIAGPDDVNYEIVDEAAPPRILRSGPLAVAIRHEFAPRAGPLTETKSTLDLTFPISKSWVEVHWQIDDPRQAARSVSVEIALNLAPPTEKEPTLIDFGASSLVYMSLAPGTASKLRAQRAMSQPESIARQSWEVLRSAKERLEPFAVRSSGVQSSDAEGWAHIMDRRRCLALAIDEFGKAGDDLIETSAEGNVSLARRFKTDESDRSATKRFRFWLHFVGFPPHLTAATSPQSMLSPLVVRISKP